MGFHQSSVSGFVELSKPVQIENIIPYFPKVDFLTYGEQVLFLKIPGLLIKLFPHFLSYFLVNLISLNCVNFIDDFEIYILCKTVRNSEHKIWFQHSFEPYKLFDERLLTSLREFIALIEQQLYVLRYLLIRLTLTNSILYQNISATRCIVLYAILKPFRGHPVLLEHLSLKLRLLLLQLMSHFELELVKGGGLQTFLGTVITYLFVFHSFQKVVIVGVVRREFYFQVLEHIQDLVLVNQKFEVLLAIQMNCRNVFCRQEIVSNSGYGCQRRSNNHLGNHVFGRH